MVSGIDSSIKSNQATSGSLSFSIPNTNNSIKIYQASSKLKIDYLNGASTTNLLTLGADGCCELQTLKILGDPLATEYGGTGAISDINAKSNLSINPTSIGALALAGGTMTGNIIMRAASGTGNDAIASASIKLTTGDSNNPCEFTLRTFKNFLQILRKKSSAESPEVSFQINSDGVFYLENPLSVAYGGTGLSASPSLRVNLASTSAENILVASPRPGVQGVLPIANGGTGGSTAILAKVNLGIGTANQNFSINKSATAGQLLTMIWTVDNTSDTDYNSKEIYLIPKSTGLLLYNKTSNIAIWELSFPLSVANGGTGYTSLQATRNAMGLGNTTGALPIANGGTGASSISQARANFHTYIIINSTDTLATVYDKISAINTYETVSFFSDSNFSYTFTNGAINNQSLKGFITKLGNNISYDIFAMVGDGNKLIAWRISDFGSGSATPTFSTVKTYTGS